MVSLHVLGLRELFDNEWMKFGESLVAPGFGFPFSDDWVVGPEHMTAALKKGDGADQ